MIPAFPLQRRRQPLDPEAVEHGARPRHAHHARPHTDPTPPGNRPQGTAAIREEIIFIVFL